MKETGLAVVQEQHAQVIVAKVGIQRIEDHVQWPVLSRMPMRLSAAIPISGFKVRDLLALEAGKTVATAWPSTDDVPVRLGSVQLSWSEFEVVEGRMAIRLTRLA